MADKDTEQYLRKENMPHIWCPGCGNGILMHDVIRAIHSLGLNRDRVCIVSGIGCSSRAAGYMNFSTVHTTHGRAIPFATGVKLADPTLEVIVITGDGDLAAIGGNHFIHACRRNIGLTVVVFNNEIYGMTGGQMAPTTLLGMKTATTPYGRDPRLNGYPYKIAEMMAHLDGTAYITRQSVHTPANVRKCKRALRKAFETAMAGKGFSLVEVVSTCNSGWKMSPVAANEWLAQNMLPYYPLGDIKSNE